MRLGRGLGRGLGATCLSGSVGEGWDKAWARPKRGLERGLWRLGGRCLGEARLGEQAWASVKALVAWFFTINKFAKEGHALRVFQAVQGVNMTASFGVGEGVNMTPSSDFGRLSGK